ncbi:MAG: response regulator transcription factor [Acidimicrobiia bacterium]
MSVAGKPRILVADDEAGIREVVGRYLEAEGYDVAFAHDGAEALSLARAHEPDLVVLDVMMPGLDGIEVLRQLRAESDVYVIMLTARADEVDKIVGLSVGADDYLAKPFSPRELVARIKAVLRRSRGTASVDGGDRLVFDGLEIDPVRRETTRDGRPVTLSALEFDLLTALARAPGRAFTRRQLIEKVWGWDFYGDERVVDVHIRSIRRALDDSADAPEIVGTVRGVGYRFLGRPR